MRSEGLVQLCKRPSIDWFGRAFLMLLGCAFFTHQLGDTFFVYWWAFYALNILVGFIYARKFAQAPTLTTYRVTIASNVADSIASAVLFAFMWTYGLPVLQLTSMIFMTGSLLYILSIRLRVPTLSKLDLLYLQSIISFGWIWILTQGEITGMDIALVVALVGLQAFHLITLLEIRSDLAEIENTKQRSQQAQRMEAVGRLTGGISHDFNNILTVILGNLELYNEIEDPIERRELIEESRAAALRASALTSQLLSFSRQVPLQVTRIDMDRLAVQTKAIVDRVLPSTIHFQIDIGTQGLTVMADPNYLNSAILNLVLNARDALSNKGTIGLNISQLQRNHVQRLRLDPGDYVSISVTDDGPGFEADVLSRAFDPYFTTKNVGDGSGLGLSMVKGFAEQSKGLAVAGNRVAGGAKVEIILPSGS